MYLRSMSAQMDISVGGFLSLDCPSQAPPKRGQSCDSVITQPGEGMADDELSNHHVAAVPLLLSNIAKLNLHDYSDCSCQPSVVTCCVLHTQTIGVALYLCWSIQSVYPIESV